MYVYCSRCDEQIIAEVVGQAVLDGRVRDLGQSI